MSRILRAFLISVALVCPVLCGAIPLPACQAASDADRTAATTDASGGSVSGTVTYRPDPARPWRYSRYFVKNPKTGELAEAVVALRSRALRGLSRSDKPVTWTMDQEFFQFTPQTMAIRAGDFVEFLNSDATTHNVRASSPIATFNANMAPDFSYKHRFDRAGGMATPVQLGCVFHGGMQAWIFVFDHPFFAVTGEDGRFTFRNVPPGRYRLDVFHPLGRLRMTRLIEIEAGSESVEPFSLSPSSLVP